MFKLRTLVILALALLAAGPVAAEDDFKTARPKITQELKTKRPPDRVEAVKKLSSFHEVEAAKLLLQINTQDFSADVREAAFLGLIETCQDDKVRSHFFSQIKRSGSTKDPADSCVILAALLAADQGDKEQELLDFIDKSLVPQPSGVLLLVMMADAMGVHAQKVDATALERLSRTQIFGLHFGLRRAMCDALKKIQKQEALGVLVGLMNRVEGEIQAELVAYLTTLTGQQLGIDAAAWAKWWAENRGTFQFPAGPLQNIPLPVGAAAAAPSSGSYYGMPIYAKRVVFIIDTSGSMTGPRIEAAKRELVQAISSLAESTQFTIVVFNSSVRAWQKQLVAADSQRKQQAITFVMGQSAMSNTNTFGALEAAFGFNAEAIYLLTDGAPSSGKVVAPPDILAVVSQTNRIRRESIHTIGIGVGPPGDLFDAFLSGLAQQNFGLYRRVDN